MVNKKVNKIQKFFTLQATFFPLELVGTDFVVFVISSHVITERPKEYMNHMIHLVSRFACNTRVIVDGNSNPTVSLDQIVVTKTLNQVIK